MPVLKRSVSGAFELPEGTEKISGLDYPTREAQRGAFENPTPDPTGTFLYGKRKPLIPAGEEEPALQQTSQPTNTADAFNKLLLSTLKQAQGVDSNELLKRKRALQRAQLGAEQEMTPEDLRTLSPEQQARIRAGEAGTYQPDIDENEFQILQANKAIKNFEDTFFKALQFGAEFAEKMVLPDSMIENYKKVIEADPDNMSTILSTVNDKSKQAIINSLDYTKLTPKKDNKILSTIEAERLGVPYGTTKKQASDMGISPSDVWTKDEKFKAEINISDKFLSQVKDPQKALVQLGLMKTAEKMLDDDLTNGMLNPVSQSILVTFQKLLDPNSVVRESEYGRSGAGQDLAGRIKGFWTKLNEGGADVTKENLRGFVILSQEFAKHYEQSIFNAANLAKTRAENNDLNINNILTRDIIDMLEKTDEVPDEEISASIPPLTQSYTSIETLIENQPEYLSIVEKLGNNFPNADDSELLRLLYERDSGESFSQVGDDTNKVAKFSAKYPEGSKGGQCGDFAHKIVDFPTVGDKKSEKYATVDKSGISRRKWVNQGARVGDIVVTGEDKTYGHIAIVNAVNPDGTVTLTESNYKDTEKISHDRRLAMSSAKIYGAIRGKLKS